MLGAVPRPLRRSVRDRSESERAWGGAEARGLVTLGDLPKAARRLSLTLHLAGAALRDPRAFRTTAVAVRHHRALQKPLELFHYLRFLQPRGIARCLEIGTL